MRARKELGLLGYFGLLGFFGTRIARIFDGGCYEE